MKAPTDKSNDIIQIEITTACGITTCSNCTRLLPFRRDFRHMDPEVFRQAVRSLQGWPGVVALFGGDPPCHPQFEEICSILAEEVPQQSRRGLWASSLGKHGELIREVFYPHGRFNLNSHTNSAAAEEINLWLPGKIIPTSRIRPSWHSSVLLCRQDLGFSSSAWEELRERCDVNCDWSAAILERDGQPYAYFCEVAGALDGIRGENHGVLAEPGWWKWKIDRFRHQVVHICDRGCGIPLRRLGHLDIDCTYDYTESFASLIEPMFEAGKLKGCKHLQLPEGTEKATDYQALKTRKPLRRNT